MSTEHSATQVSGASQLTEKLADTTLETTNDSSTATQTITEAPLMPKLTISQIDLEGESSSTSIQFYHIENNFGGMFSAKKKQCPLWETVWGSSILMSRVLWKWIHDMPEAVKPSVLEIGGGIGLSSLAALRTDRCKSVLMTDLVQDALDVFQKSVDLLPERKLTTVETKTLDWNKEEQVPCDAFDIVIGADILFGQVCVTPVSNAINRALKVGGVALVTDPCRLYDEEFVQKLNGLGLATEVYSIPSNLLKQTETPEGQPRRFVQVVRGKLIVAWKNNPDVDGVENYDLKHHLNGILESLDILPESESG